jgi:hypothetical protein
MRRSLMIIAALLISLPFYGCATSSAVVGSGVTSEYGTPYNGGRYMCVNGTCVDREKNEEEDGR